MKRLALLLAFLPVTALAQDDQRTQLPIPPSCSVQEAINYMNAQLPPLLNEPETEAEHIVSIKSFADLPRTNVEWRDATPGQHYQLNCSIAITMTGGQVIYGQFRALTQANGTITVGFKPSR